MFLFESRYENWPSADGTKRWIVKRMYIFGVLIYTSQGAAMIKVTENYIYKGSERWYVSTVRMFGVVVFKTERRL